jgi:hypothetical protein
MLRKPRSISLQMLLKESVVLHRTRHTHKLQLLNASNHSKNISAAAARLIATILTSCIALCRCNVSSFRRTSLVTLNAQVFGLRDIIYNRANVTGGFVLMTNIAKHIVWRAA